MTWSISCSGTKEEVLDILGRHTQTNLSADSCEAKQYERVKAFFIEETKAATKANVSISASGWGDHTPEGSTNMNVGTFSTYDPAPPTPAA